MQGATCQNCKSNLNNRAALSADRMIGPIMGVVGVVGVTILVMSMFDIQINPSSAKKRAAYAACQQFVTQKLKAPATAHFPSFEERFVTDGAGVFSVYSHVDSQNSFGAQIRTTYRCDVSTDNGEHWNLRGLAAN
jgi:hypothetical protein